MSELNKKLIDYGGLEHFRDMLLNDSVTTSASTWSSSKIATELANAGFDVEIVQSLPESGDAHTIYFTPASESGVTDVYDEFMWVDNAWEQVGSTRLDLSDYYTSAQTNTLLAGKQDTLVAGSGITISGNTISATGGGAGGDAIEDVQVLPDVAGNENKIVRFGEDNQLYYVDITSETNCSNKLPDAQQIDKTYIYNNEDIYYYKGNWKIILFDGEVDGYGWLEYNNDNEWYLYVTQDDAEDSTGNTKMFYFYADEVDGVDFENHTVTHDDSIEGYQWKDADTITGDGGIVIPATYNASEANQIGNAYLSYENELTQSVIYTGEELTFVLSDGQIIGYKWSVPNETSLEITSKPASQIYYSIGLVDNANYIYTDTKIWHIGNPEDLELEGWTISGNTFTNTNMSVSDFESDNIISLPVDEIKNIYIPQQNAQESEQIDVAELDNDNDIPYTYKGEITGYFTDGTVTLYRWHNEDNVDYNFFTKEAASEIFNIHNVHGASEDGLTLYWDETEEKWISTDLTVSEANNILLTTLEDNTGVDWSDGIVKYNICETTVYKNWKSLTEVATDEDIDDIWAVPPTPPTPTPSGNYFYLLKGRGYAPTKLEALVHTPGDTFELDGQTYYKWYKYEENDGTTEMDSAWDNLGAFVLTNTLDIEADNDNMFNREHSAFVAVIADDETDDYLRVYNYFSSFYDETDGKYYMLKDGFDYQLSKNEGLKHTAGDTVEYEGQTCYKWYKTNANEDGEYIGLDSGWDNLGAYLLTNTLNVQVPFTYDSPEFVAVIADDEVNDYLGSSKTYYQLVIE